MLRLLPFILGRDCIGCAKTGSGKTAAFALPILHRLAEDPYGVFALVITPTRYIHVGSLNLNHYIVLLIFFLQRTCISNI